MEIAAKEEFCSMKKVKYVTSDTSKDSNADAHMVNKEKQGEQSAKIKAQC